MEQGGYVSSEVFDHTSIIRLMEARWAETHPGLMETNITPWRRAVAGDLTSAFNFRNPNAKVVALPSTAAYLPPNQNRYPDYAPPVPTDQTMPTQERGTRPARPLPYDLNAFGSMNGADGTFSIEFVNAGKAAVLQVRPGNSGLGPWTYTVGEGAHLSDTWPITRNNLSGYDLSVYGPNGFLRAFRGRISGARAANLDVRAAYDREGNVIRLIVTNRGSQTVTLQIRNVHGKGDREHTAAACTGTLEAGAGTHLGMVRRDCRGRTGPDVPVADGRAHREWSGEQDGSGHRRTVEANYQRDEIRGHLRRVGSFPLCICLDTYMPREVYQRNGIRI